MELLYRLLGERLGGVGAFRESAEREVRLWGCKRGCWERGKAVRLFKRLLGER